MVKDEEAPADAAQAPGGAAGGDASGGRKKRKAAIKKEVIVISGDEASSGEEEAYKPGAESESEDFEADGDSGEDEPGSESDDEPIAKKKKKVAAGAGKKKKKKADDEDDFAPPPEPSPAAKAAASKAQAKAAAKKAELATGAPTFACRMAGVTAQDWVAALAQFEECTGKKLTALLKHNNLASSGVNKAELVARCAEAALLGCLPACPACRQARLKFDEEGSKIAVELMISCPGHFNDDRSKYFSCKFVAPATGLKRAPWRSLDEAAPEGEAGGDAGGDTGGAASGAALLDDATAARIAEISDVRAAADAVLAEVARLKLSVPSAGLPRQDVGAVLLANRDSATGKWDARKVLAVFAEKYPAAVSFDAGGAGGAAGGDASCRVAANSALAEAFSTLAEAAEDHWKRNTFTTAAKAIRLWPTAIVKGKELSEGPRKVKGVGASCAKLIDEFIKTGAIAPAPPKA